MTLGFILNVLGGGIGQFLKTSIRFVISGVGYTSDLYFKRKRLVTVTKYSENMVRYSIINECFITLITVFFFLVGEKREVQDHRFI